MQGKGPMSFDETLNDPVNLSAFKTFCVQDYSTENLLFWLEVEFLGRACCLSSIRLLREHPGVVMRVPRLLSCSLRHVCLAAH
eukprot:6174417-Pleurochrysis_carterae.AAC.2